jgi:hypothetical protein
MCAGIALRVSPSSNSSSSSLSSVFSPPSCSLLSTRLAPRELTQLSSQTSTALVLRLSSIMTATTSPMSASVARQPVSFKWSTVLQPRALCRVATATLRITSFGHRSKQLQTLGGAPTRLVLQHSRVRLQAPPRLLSANTSFLVETKTAFEAVFVYPHATLRRESKVYTTSIYY